MAVAPRRLTVEVTVSSYSSYMAFSKATRPRLARRGDETGRRRAAGSPASSRPRASSCDTSPRTRGRGVVAVAFPLVRNRARRQQAWPTRLFALPGQLAAERTGRVVVALDEFQAIEALRRWQRRARAAGSRAAPAPGRATCSPAPKPSLMEKMIGPRRPFYKAGPVIRLEKDSRGRLLGLRRAPLHQDGHQARTRPRCGDRGLGGQPALRRAATGARNGTTCAARSGRSRTRPPARHARAAC